MEKRVVKWKRYREELFQNLNFFETLLNSDEDFRDQVDSSKKFLNEKKILEIKSTELFTLNFLEFDIHNLEDQIKFLTKKIEKVEKTKKEPIEINIASNQFDHLHESFFGSKKDNTIEIKQRSFSYKDDE